MVVCGRSSLNGFPCVPSLLLGRNARESIAPWGCPVVVRPISQGPPPRANTPTAVVHHKLRSIYCRRLPRTCRNARGIGENLGTPKRVPKRLMRRTTRLPPAPPSCPSSSSALPLLTLQPRCPSPGSALLLTNVPLLLLLPSLHQPQRGAAGEQHGHRDRENARQPRALFGHQVDQDVEGAIVRVPKLGPNDPDGFLLLGRRGSRGLTGATGLVFGSGGAVPDIVRAVIGARIVAVRVIVLLRTKSILRNRRPFSPGD